MKRLKILRNMLRTWKSVLALEKQEIQNAHLENRRKLKDSSFKKIREEKHWNAYRFKVKFKILQNSKQSIL